MEEGQVLANRQISHSFLALLWFPGKKSSHEEMSWLVGHRVPSTKAPGSLWIAGLCPCLFQWALTQTKYVALQFNEMVCNVGQLCGSKCMTQQWNPSWSWLSWSIPQPLMQLFSWTVIMQLNLMYFHTALSLPEISADFARLQSGWCSRWTGRWYKEYHCFTKVN